MKDVEGETNNYKLNKAMSELIKFEKNFSPEIGMPNIKFRELFFDILRRPFKKFGLQIISENPLQQHVNILERTKLEKDGIEQESLLSMFDYNGLNNLFFVNELNENVSLIFKILPKTKMAIKIFLPIEKRAKKLVKEIKTKTK